jgi:hypothetical protein
MKRWILLVSMLSLALGSCGGSPQIVAARQSSDSATANPKDIAAEEIPTDLPENPIQLASTPETTDMDSNPPSSDKFIQLAKKNLAGRLNVDINMISLIEAVEMTWPNAALGCPSPGKVYATVQVPGYRLRLLANEVEYAYNTDLTGQVIFCPDQNDEAGGPFNITPGSTPDPNIGVPVK